MLNGVMLLWFLLAAASVVFVAIDIRRTPESPVLRWGFVLLTAYTGPVGALLYVLGCREPLPGLHERYTAARWRQVLGSTMHCVAGDGVGILAGAALAAMLALPRWSDLALEYALGFGFGWTIFQAMFMRDMAGGSYQRSLTGTFVPEFLSMNFLMSGMVPIEALGRRLLGRAPSPAIPEFWFVMSMALLVGFVAAYPMNWWLVSNGLKHGMMTVYTDEDSSRQNNGARHHHRPETADRGAQHFGHAAKSHESHQPRRPSQGRIAAMAAVSVAAFALAIGVAALIGRE